MWRKEKSTEIAALLRAFLTQPPRKRSRESVAPDLCGVALAHIDRIVPLNGFERMTAMSNAWTTRRDRIFAALPDQSYIAVLFAGAIQHRSEDAGYPFAVNRNFFYLTGLNRHKCALVSRVTQGKREDTLFVEFVDDTQAKWVGPGLDHDYAITTSGIETIKDIAGLDVYLANQYTSGHFSTLYLDLPNISWAPHSDAHQHARKVQSAFPHMCIKNFYPHLCDARLIKDKDEVDYIRQAIDITHKGLANMWAHGKPQMTEGQWESWFNWTLLQHGVRTPAFPTIACAGARSVILHYDQNDQVIQDGELLLTDLGAMCNVYAADITRTVPANGRFTDRQRAVYNAVLAANEASYAAMHPGYTTKEFNELVKTTLADGCRKLGLIQNDEELARYYYHSAGHPLGLDVHDVGGRDLTLRPGMVITVEPGLYIAEEGIGVRIEDDVLITETGCEVLSAAIPRTAEAIEAVFAERA